MQQKPDQTNEALFAAGHERLLAPRVCVISPELSPLSIITLSLQGKQVADFWSYSGIESERKEKKVM